MPSGKKRNALAHPIMSRSRKRAILERACAVLEMADPLSIEVHELLYAFDLAASHVKKGGTYATRLAEQQELALGLIDWAICQTDRGEGLLKAMTRPDELARR